MSVDGTWNMTMNTPMGPQSGSLTVQSDGDSFTGQMTGPQGAVDVQDGKVEGDKLSWKVTAAQMNMTIEFTATVDGDAISGEAALGAFGTASLEGTRA